MSFTSLCGGAFLTLSNMLDKKATKKQTTCPLCHGVFEQEVSLQGNEGLSFNDDPNSGSIQSLCPWGMMGK
jgi:hypothetical protein